MQKDYGMTRWNGTDRESCTSSLMDIREQFLKKVKSIFLIYGAGIKRGLRIIFVKALCCLIATLSPKK